MTYKRKFTEYMAARIRFDRQHGMKMDDLSYKYRASQPTIYMVVAHKGAYAHTYRQHEKYNRHE
jgi:Mor family transcriptional regulator